MSESFDPYHKLLGISKRDQPPTHYRLLGIEDLEADREVIDAAANRQMAYLQSCCNGDHAASAEQLINEVSSARLRLLNPQSKSEYDEQLRAAQPQHPAAEFAVRETPVYEAPVVEVPVSTSPVIAAPQVRVSRQVRKQSSGVVQWIFGAIMSVAVLWGASMMGWIDFGGGDAVESRDASTTYSELLRQRGDRSVADITSNDERLSTSELVDNASTPSNTANWSDTPNQSTNRALIQSSAPLRRSSSRPSKPAEKPPNNVQPVRDFSATERERLEGFRNLAQMPGVSASPNSSALRGRNMLADQPEIPVGSRSPIPSEDQLAEANADIQATLASQIKAAKTPHEMKHLGTVIDELARETAPPAARYALLKTARDISTEAGDFDGAMLAIDQIQGQFEISGLEQRLAVMQKLEPLLYHPLDQVAMADQAETLIDNALMEENYAAAGELCEICRKLSKDLRNGNMVKKFLLKAAETETLLSQHPTVVLARERLASEPGNVKANEFLGRFLCFGKSQWNEGLPYLALSEDAQLRELATADMQPQTTAAELESVGDQWWGFSIDAENQPLVMRTTRQRAIDYYRRAIAHGLSGLAKAAAETRINTAQEDPSSDFAIARTLNAEGDEPQRPRGVPDAAIYFNGNWYLFSNQQINQPAAIAIAQKAGGRPVVVRSQAENDFLVAHKNGNLMLGMMLRDGVWYDALGERQYFFLWDVRNRQPDPQLKEAWVAIYEFTSLWHDFNIRPMYFVIEWGRE